MTARTKNLVGQKFGMLTALSYAGRSANRIALWVVRCDCGTEKTIQSTNLGRQQSCGCLKQKQTSERFSTHGPTPVGNHHPLYRTWDGMKRRCHGKHLSRKWYGDRGIVVCDRWRFGAVGKTGFECFVADMGPRPSKKHTINRINNDGPYSPENCEWATQTEQQRNRSSNRIVTFRGRQMLLIEAIEISGIKEGTVSARLAYGWPVERALTEKPRNRDAEREAS